MSHPRHKGGGRSAHRTARMWNFPTLGGTMSHRRRKNGVRRQLMCKRSAKSLASFFHAVTSASYGALGASLVGSGRSTNDTSQPRLSDGARAAAADSSPAHSAA